MKNKAEIIKGIEQIVAGLEIVKNAITVEEVAVPVAEEPKAKVGTKKIEKTPFKEATNVKEEKEETTEVVAGEYTREQLNSMKYNEFKKVAAALGVKCTGTRDEIMERILALENGEAEVEEVEEEETVEEAPKKKAVEEAPKSNKSTGGKKLSKTKAIEPAKDEFDEQAEEIAKDTSVEDIIEALDEVGVKATKKNALEQLAYALREGLIELEDEEDEEEVAPAVSEVEEDEEEISANSYFAEYDPKGYNDPKTMSKERAKAIESKMDEILTLYSDGKLTDEEVSSYVEDNANEYEIELLGGDYNENDILKLYMELIKRTIDNDGEEHEPSDPYEVADKDVCCGHELSYSKKTNKYICEQCGTEYEAE